MTNMIHVREANKSDLKTLLEFEQGVIEAERPLTPSLKEGHINYYDLNDLISSKSSTLLVATSNEEVIGCGYAQIRTSKEYHHHDQHSYLGFMYVKPQFRGQGINKIILDELVKWSEAQGVDEVILEVYDKNGPAIKAYTKAGFSTNIVEMRLSIKKDYR